MAPSTLTFKIHGLLALFTYHPQSSWPNMVRGTRVQISKACVEKGNLSHYGREEGQMDRWLQCRNLYVGDKLRKKSQLRGSLSKAGGQGIC